MPGILTYGPQRTSNVNSDFSATLGFDMESSPRGFRANWKMNVMLASRMGLETRKARATGSQHIAILRRTL
ncbi:hypothetical protein EMIT0P218_30201 [Pseudomonas sp. IT-P218]